jgi:hypothetical protein
LFGFRLEVVPGSLPRKETRKRSKRFLSLSVGRRCAPQQQGEARGQCVGGGRPQRT